MSLLELADRIEGAKGPDNKLDVLCEVALFRPRTVYASCRSNAAGTKVIYTDHCGNEVTCWAQNWSGERRKDIAAALRAIHAQQEQTDGQ